MRHKTALGLVGSTLTLALSGCASTTFQSTWKDPAARPLGFAGKKVVAMVVVPDTATRKGAEDELAVQLTKRGVEGLPSSAVIPENEIKDKDKVKARLKGPRWRVSWSCTSRTRTSS